MTPVVLKDFGSFHVGGRRVALDHLPIVEKVVTEGAPPRKVDPNGEFEVEQMYVSYMVPEPTRSRHPLLMWHGGGVTGACWETKPDGQPGWQHYFLSRGHAVYVSDAVERGRASWARYPEIFAEEPIFRSKREAWETFRMGPKGSYDSDPAKREAFEGSQFPVASFDQLAKQFVPRWNVNYAATLRAYMAELDRVGPSVLMLHSQSGVFGFQAALARPDLVKGIVAVEPAGAPIPASALHRLKDIPMLVLWGDNVSHSDIWRQQQPSSREFMHSLNAMGGRVQWIDLPEVGVRGNSHMVMMDTNSDVVASMIQNWMAENAFMV